MQRRGYLPHRDDEDPQVLRFIKSLAVTPQAANTAAG
jgi:hypothetical protein